MYESAKRRCKNHHTLNTRMPILGTTGPNNTQHVTIPTKTTVYRSHALRNPNNASSLSSLLRKTRRGSCHSQDMTRGPSRKQHVYLDLYRHTERCPRWTANRHTPRTVAAERPRSEVFVLVELAIEQAAQAVLSRTNAALTFAACNQWG